MLSTKNETGALSLPLLAALMAISLAGMGTWGVMRHWRHVIELQLRLDRCVGEAALDLRQTLGRIEKENLAMEAARAAVAIGTVLAPEAAAALREALEAAVAAQEAEIGRWQIRRGLWIARRGCGEESWLWTRAPALPKMPWHRPPPDVLGPKPLDWTGGQEPLRIELARAPRASAALVWIDPDGRPGKLGEWKNELSWKAAWTVPSRGSAAWGKLEKIAGSVGPGHH
jgi:hypothetical protein